MVIQFSLPDDLANLPPWDYAHYIAIQTWLNDYQPPANASRLEQVQGALEAIHHGCEARLWELAHQIAMTRIPTHKEPLHTKLGQWGYYREQIDLYKALYGRIHPQFDTTCLHGMGHAYLQLTDMEAATQQFETLRTLAQTMGETLAEARAWGGLALVAINQINYKQAIPLCERWLHLARAASDPEQQALALGQLGLARVFLGQGQSGIACLEKGLTLAEEMARQQPDTTLPSLIQMDLASAWIWRNQPAKAMPYLQARLDFFRQREEGFQQVEVLRLMGRCQFLLKEFDDALAFFQQALALAETLHLEGGTALICHDLGVIYTYGLRDFTPGIPLFARTAELFQAQHNWGVAALPYAHLAYCHAALRQRHLAAQYIQLALDGINQALESSIKGVVLACLAKTYWEQRNYLQAFWHIGRSLLVAPPWANVNGWLIWRKFLEQIKFW
jgi:tetratricopeptide (TPR) repeat protein